MSGDYLEVPLQPLLAQQPRVAEGSHVVAAPLGRQGSVYGLVEREFVRAADDGLQLIHPPLGRRLGDPRLILALSDGE